MNIYSFVGKSGTGKSFQAADLTSEYHIESIIDDGLFIVRGAILAGVSAKRQSTKITAIKTALFTDEKIREQVIDAIRLADPKSILILGTSDRMINIIRERLNLPAPIKKFNIEDLTTEEERQLAHKHRTEYGQHVIPAPTLQIKKDFSGYFIHPLRSIKEATQDIRVGPIGRPPIERSIVRPTYSYLGNYAITDKAIRDIVTLAANEVDGVDSLRSIYIKKQDGSVIIELGVIIKYGVNAIATAKQLQIMAETKVDEITSINILSVDIEIQGLLWLNNR